VLETLRISQREDLFSGLTLGEKKALDLDKLTFCPETQQKSSRTLEIVRQQLVEASAQSRRSSAKKKKREKAGPLLDALIGFQVLALQASKIFKLKYSIHKMKM
jgi:hypothetical protein